LFNAAGWYQERTPGHKKIMHQLLQHVNNVERTFPVSCSRGSRRVRLPNVFDALMNLIIVIPIYLDHRREQKINFSIGITTFVAPSVSSCLFEDL